jgi:hypothetical protein
MQVREAYVSLVVLALMLGAHGIESVSSWTILAGGGARHFFGRLD